MRDKSRVKHLVQKLNANINYDSKPQIDYGAGKVKMNPSLMKGIQLSKMENHLEKQINGTPASKVSQNGISERKMELWKSTTEYEPLAAKFRIDENQNKVHDRQTNDTMAAMHVENSEHTCDASATTEELVRLRETENRLTNEIQELREQNELLEFRLLELEYYNMNSTNRSDTADTNDRDDVSDSGVTSLSPCDDFYLDFDSILDAKLMDDDDHQLISNEIQHKLSKLGEYVENKSDKVIVQRAIDLIKHYQMRATGMETALTNMCQERIHQQCENEFLSCLKSRDEERLKIKPNRVVATVPPFSSQTNDSSNENFVLENDRLHESGIFDEFGDLEAIEWKSCEIRTDTDDSLDGCPQSDCSAGGLADELSKLEKIKRRIEERRSLFNSIEMESDEGNDDTTTKESKIQNEKSTPLTKVAILAKELSYYKNHYRQLEEKLTAYEANPDSKTRRLSDALTKESVLKHRVEYLTNKMVKMQKEMKRLEEEKCEYEEAENDTRLRCQKLEVKLYALAEKKNDIQFQLQQHVRTISNLRNTLTELEKKKDEAFGKLHDMETLVNEYEQRNFELEEREMEVRYRLQMLESALPALILWNVLAVLKRLQQKIEKHYEVVSKKNSIVSNKLLATCEREIATVQQHCPVISQKIAFYHTNDESTDESVATAQNHLEMNMQFVFTSNIRRRSYSRLNGTNVVEMKLSQLQPGTTNERVYAQTLQQADELITNMESEFEKKLKDMENTLKDKRWKLEECERKLANVSTTRELENQLTEKTLSLEAEIVSLKRKLKSNEDEKLSWQRKERDFVEEIERLNAMVGIIEDSKLQIREQLEREHTVNKEFEDELAFKKKEIQDLECQHANQIKQLENRLQRTKREVENNEVTNSELREEVDTLENAICEINATLEREKDEKEKLLIQFRKELARKQQEIDSLKRLSQDMTAVSTAQEIGFLQRQSTITTQISPNHHFYEERSRVLKSESSTDHEDGDVNEEEFDHEEFDTDPANENLNTSKNENQPGARLMRFQNGYTILLRKLPTASNFC